MPRFVILRHELPPDQERGSHFDLMLEVGNVLRTWSLPELLSPDEVIPARALPDHRLAYLEYEGPVSGGRGTVSRLEEGEYEVVEECENLLRYRLAGQGLTGMLTLRRDEQEKDLWEATFPAE